MSSGHVEQSEEAAAVLRMAFAFVISQALYVAADLGIADHLAHGSLKVEDLASKLHLHPGALARLLQALVAFGILKRDGVRFGLSPTGQLLRSNSPRSLRSTVRFLVGPWAWRAFEQLGYSVRTGQPSFDHVWGMSNFEYWERNPDVSTIHDDAMTGVDGHGNGSGAGCIRLFAVSHRCRRWRWKRSSARCHSSTAAGSYRHSDRPAARS